jgi:hypothetical protein
LVAFTLPILGIQDHVEDFRGLQVRGRVEQQRSNRQPAGLEVAFELRAKRANLVRSAERVEALIQAALGFRPVLVERALGEGRYPGRDSTRVEHPAGRDIRANGPLVKRHAAAVIAVARQALTLATTITITT